MLATPSSSYAKGSYQVAYLACYGTNVVGSRLWDKIEVTKDKILFIVTSHCVQAVSYTHLDVYKRQILLCATNIDARTSKLTA